MKVLFLDVDGVLNTTKSKSFYSLGKSYLRRLSEVVEKTGCRVVISSTWRKDPFMLKVLRKRLQYRGIEIYGTTPIAKSGPRGAEIQAWLLDHEGSVEKYAILDDGVDMLQTQLPNFFQTDPDHGLTPTIAYRVIYHLNN